jgi:hypothetical protein
VNYWSHDDRTFKESGGLSEMKAALTVYKFYINSDGNYVDAEGNVIPEGAQQYFEAKTLDITGYTNPAENLNSPEKVWDNETAEFLGKAKGEWTLEEELSAPHANKYPLTVYYTYDPSEDPDFDINNGAPLELGTIRIYIGVKGDFNLDNKVEPEDAQLTLQYYADHVLAQKAGFLSDDPELDGEDGLVFFLCNVCYRDGSSASDPLCDPQKLETDDAQGILRYYAIHTLAKHYDRSWDHPDIVGYDYLDYFYGDKIQ